MGGVGATPNAPEWPNYCFYLLAVERQEEEATMIKNRSGRVIALALVLLCAGLAGLVSSAGSSRAQVSALASVPSVPAVDGTEPLPPGAVVQTVLSNHYIYVYYTCGNCTTENRVARFTESGGSGSNPTTIFSSPQTAGNHNGGNIHFGPDGKLYISIGDNANAANSQDVTVKNGKMHRINPDGSIPPDNPVFTQTGAVPSLYVMGLRNSYDFTFDPLTPG